jgi:cobalamin biosynthetic protein CobC
VAAPDARGLFEHLGRTGIFARRFAEQPTWLRLGLPGAEADWQRLAAALAGYRQRRPRG